MSIILVVSGCSTMKQSADGDQLQAAETEESKIQKIISKEEKNKGIPHGILNSIAAVESKHKPYAVNARKKAHNFQTKEEAVKFVNATIDSGCKNISVGCLQLHYDSHKKNFKSLNAMLTPEENVAYAAALLKKLYDKYGTWEMAIRMYNSNKPKYNKPYYSKVMKAYNSMYRVS